MNLKRITSHVAIALLTFVVGIALTLCWFSQKQVEQQQQPAASVTSAASIAPNQIPKSENLPKEIKFPRVGSEVTTVAGKVEIIESDFLTWTVNLNGREILSSNEDGSLPPYVLKHVESRISPFDQVIILGHVDGNCCELLRFWFLGLKADGSYFLSKAIGDGFIHAPEIIVGKESIKVRIRSGTDLRPHVGFMRGGVWMLRNGRVTKQR